MCLQVKEAPFSKREGLVVRCTKHITYWAGRHASPVTLYLIPDSGWIFSSQKVTRVYHNDILGGEAVHSYEYNGSRLAYAVCVCAYSNKEIGSLALFVPTACLNTELRNRTVGILQRINPKKSLQESIRKLKTLKNKELNECLDFYNNRFRIL